MNDKLRGQIGSVLLTLALVAAVAGAGMLLIEQKLTLANEIAFGIAGVLLVAFIVVEPGRTRTWITGRQTRYGVNAIAMSLVLLGILVVANFLADSHPYRVDVTADRRLSLAPQTVDVLGSMSGPVQVVMFYDSVNMAGVLADAEDMFSQYRMHYPNMQIDYHDLQVEFAQAQQWGVTESARPTIFIRYEGRQQKINAIDQGEITSALVRLRRGITPKVYFLTGHGEPGLDDSAQSGLSTLQDRLTQEGFDVAPLNLLITTTVPSDATAVVAVGPLRPLAQEEVDGLAAFVDSGGAAMILLDPNPNPANDSPALAQWLENRWGLAFQNDLVVDAASSFTGCPYPVCPIAQPSSSNPIGRAMANTQVLFLEARSIAQVTETIGITVPNTVAFMPLVQSSPESWGNTSWDNLEYRQGDARGPLNLVVTLDDRVATARLAVFGDSNFCTNQLINQGWNGDLFINTLNWVAEDEELISIRPPSDVTRMLTVTSGLVYNAIVLFLVILLPIIVVCIGVVVLLIRRGRR
jgi:ABC-type uncharacterized transport system involved in gliding motility auxiliary subunit